MATSSILAKESVRFLKMGLVDPASPAMSISLPRWTGDLCFCRGE